MFIKNGDSFRYIGEVADLTDKVPDGVYKYTFTGFPGESKFTKMTMNSDKIVDIPTDSFTETVEEFKQFLLPETKDLYEKMGLIYKKSVLLEGPPGTGKTILVQRLVKEMVKQQNVVVAYDPNPKYLNKMFEALKSQPETMLVVIFEEFDSWVVDCESELLTVLDGEEQRPNTLFLMTTNYLERIPARLLRPSRVSSIIHVGMPSAEARKVFLMSKGIEETKAKEITNVTEGFTIDEVKEVMVGHIVLKNTLEKMTNRVVKYRTQGGE